MKVVEHIEMKTLNPLLDACSRDFGFDHYQLEPNVFQESDQRQAISVNMHIRTCIIKKANNRNIIDDDSRWNKDVLSILSHYFQTLLEQQASVIIPNDDKNLVNASSPKE